MHQIDPELEKTCRTCLSKIQNGCENLFHTKNSNEIPLVEKLSLITSLSMQKDDGLPKIVCEKCLEMLNDAYNFRVLSINSDMQLKHNLTKQSTVETKAVTLPIKTNQEDNSNELFSCLECNRSFKTSRTLNFHRKQIHDALKLKENEIKIDENATEAKLSCHICNKTYLKASNLSAHMGLHTGIEPFSCTICGKKFTQGRAYACHMRIHQSTKKICSKCNAQFRTENELKVHKKVECLLPDTNSKKNKMKSSLTCQICGKKFCNSSNLQAHMRLHTGNFPYSCHICSKKFAQSNAHSYHMNTHFGIKNYSCEFCTKCFTTNGQLINHKRLHSGERPFSCTFCPKKFTQKVTLTVHLMTHTNEKPHLCSVCGKKYAQNSQLVEHMRVHTGQKYKCDQCNRCYTTSGNLVAHIRTHSGIKPHSCSICQKSFYVANKLVKHMKVHNKQKSMCTICSKLFQSTELLSSHMKIHTNKKVQKHMNKNFTNLESFSAQNNTFVPFDNLDLSDKKLFSL